MAVTKNSWNRINNHGLFADNKRPRPLLCLYVSGIKVQGKRRGKNIDNKLNLVTEKCKLKKYKEKAGKKNIDNKLCGTV